MRHTCRLPVFEVFALCLRNQHWNLTCFSWKSSVESILHVYIRWILAAKPYEFFGSSQEPEVFRKKSRKPRCLKLKTSGIDFASPIKYLIPLWCWNRTTETRRYKPKRYPSRAHIRLRELSKWAIKYTWKVYLLSRKLIPGFHASSSC